MDHYVETLKQKKKVLNIPMGKTKDGRHWIELETFMLYLAKVNKEDIPTLIEYIPKPYFKTVNVDGKGKVKYIDRMAIGMVASQLNDYELYKFTVSRTNNKIEKYYPMVFVEMLTVINSKIGNIPMLSDDISNIDRARNDLLHMNENTDELSKEDKLSFYDDLHILQCERRKKKVNFEYLVSLRKFFENHNIKGSEISNLYNAINGLSNIASKKIYNKRATTTQSLKYIASQNK